MPFDRKESPSSEAITSPAQLVAALPENARPKSTDDTIRIDRANDWLKENATGRKIVWEYAIGEVQLNRMEGRRYRVSISPGNGNIHKLHGLEWTVQIGNPYSGTISLEDILDDTADLLTPFKGKIIKLTAIIDKAEFHNGRLNIMADGFIFNTVKTGYPAAVEELKSGSAAERVKRIELIASFAVSAREAIPKLVEMMEDSDATVRDAALMALYSLDPTNKAAAKFRPPTKASVDGKYTKLLKVFCVPADRATYAEFRDSGHYKPYPFYGRHRDIPEGTWVWVAPYWFVWESPAR